MPEEWKHRRHTIVRAALWAVVVTGWLVAVVTAASIVLRDMFVS